jgi:hypothetical protein
MIQAIFYLLEHWLFAGQQLRMFAVAVKIKNK